MRKLLFPLLILSICCINSFAQIREEGTPLSFNTAYSSTFALHTYVPQTVLTAPDVNRLKEEDKSTKHTVANNFRIGALIPADVSFPSSGVITSLNDGRQVWRAQIKVAGAPALGLYYNNFHLPAGVKYYLYNGNGKQVLGAYTVANNNEDGLWVNEKTEGDVINLELDMDAGVSLAEIGLHINNVGFFYNSISYLDVYHTDGTVLFPYDSSSACEINAICPTGASYPHQRLASVHIEYAINPYIYAGSGTVMNNTLQDCTPYILTASHVEGTNSTANSTFSIWMFYFNYETPTCAYTGARPSSTQSMSGATFRARSSYNNTSNKIVGDFLLLQLKSNIPPAYGAYLSGWDISSNTPNGMCIGFHHPGGDVKKVSTSSNIYPNGDFNGGQANSHWLVAPWGVGGIEEGSSGSGLFNASGRLVGDLSGGYVYQPTCTAKNSRGDTMSDYAVYSKLSLNWLYTYQTPSSAATRLKDWLDPNNSGATTLDAIAATCNNASVMQVVGAVNTVSVFPNPSNGIVYINAEFNTSNGIGIEVFNIIGNKVFETRTSSIHLDQYQVDLTGNAPGLYMVRISSGSTIITRKVLISN